MTRPYRLWVLRTARTNPKKEKMALVIEDGARPTQQLRVNHRPTWEVAKEQLEWHCQTAAAMVQGMDIRYLLPMAPNDLQMDILVTPWSAIWVHGQARAIRILQPWVLHLLLASLDRTKASIEVYQTLLQHIPTVLLGQKFRMTRHCQVQRKVHLTTRRTVPITMTAKVNLVTMGTTQSEVHSQSSGTCKQGGTRESRSRAYRLNRGVLASLRISRVVLRLPRRSEHGAYEASAGLPGFL